MEIDTTTTAGKIAVMQGYADGKEVQCMLLGETQDWDDVKGPSWNWLQYNYRIKPEPREFFIKVAPDGQYGMLIYTTEAEAAKVELVGGSKVIKVREVVE
jgi:hypothetical protein